MSTQARPIDELRSMLQKMGSQFRAVLPTQEHVERFIRIVVTAAQQNPKLLEADRNSFYASCMKAAQDGLLPDGREAVLQPYNMNVGTRDKPDWRLIVQYQPMVEGMMKKLRLSGEIKGAPRVHVVKANDEFEYRLGDDEGITHKPALSKRGETIGAYSIVEFAEGGVSREYMDREQIDAVRNRSKAKDSGPWVTDYDEMARKTVFRRHSKRLPKSTDLDNVINSDNETFEPYAPAPAAGPALPAPAPVDAGTASGAARPAALQNVVDADRVPDRMPEQAPEPVPAPRSEAAGAPPADVL